MEYQIQVNGLEVKATYDQNCIDTILMPLLQKLTQIQKEKKKRILVMLAAPPGAGKSTLASFLQYLSNQYEELTPITVIGMDGFHHYQDYQLNHYVIRDGKEVNMVSIKGAPITFDLDLLTSRIKEVASGKECGWPIYNRVLHNPEEDALKVKGDIVLLEGNYLLLEDEGWNALSDYATYTIFIHSNKEFLRKRLVYRKAQGIPMHEAIQFVEKSDLVNANYVLEHSKKADLVLNMLGDGLYTIE